MAALTDLIANVNQTLNSILWGRGMLLCFLLTGLMFTVGTRFFQVRWFFQWMRCTIGSVWKKGGSQKAGEHSITPFQALSTALAAAIGTGNIVGVAIALSAGGPGAIFWMWLSAFLGMMTSFAEKTLGIRYRYPDGKGRWVGGAMVYMEKGLHCKWMALLFAALCIPVSFGMGNLSQSNSMAQAMERAFHIPSVATGAVAAVLIGIILLGGIKRIAAVTEKLVPVMAVLYLAAGGAVILLHLHSLPQAVADIFAGAFSLRSAAGGAAGYGLARALRTGVSMGVFSNEAGLGTSVIVHCDAQVKEPVEQGMWGIFEVFADTLVCCTVTALAILTSGVWQPNGAMDGVSLCAAAFSTVFGAAGDKFIAASIVLFAFATLTGWAYYGERAVCYLLGKWAVPVYKLLFSAAVLLGSVAKMELVWSLSDTFNALLAIPNLIAVTILSREVLELTQDYTRRFLIRPKAENGRIKRPDSGHNRDDGHCVSLRRERIRRKGG